MRPPGAAPAGGAAVPLRDTPSGSPPAGSSPCPATAWLATAVVAAVGAAAVTALGASPPAVPGPAKALSPPVVLGAFGVVAALALVRPSPRRDAAETAALLAVALPFHAALASAAGAGAGFHGAWLLAAAGFAALGLAAARRRDLAWSSAAAAALCFALPLSAYAGADFLGWPARTALLASPLTFPALAARDAARLAPGDGVPALVACAAAALALLLVPRRAERLA